MTIFEGCVIALVITVIFSFALFIPCLCFLLIRKGYSYKIYEHDIRVSNKVGWR